DREVVLLGDIRGRLDPELADDVTADVEPEDLARLRLGLVRGARELDPARLAAAAREHLRLDDDLAAEVVRGRARLLRRRRDTPVGDGDAGAAKQLLALVLVQIHWAAASLTAGRLALRRSPVDEARQVGGEHREAAEHLDHRRAAGSAGVGEDVAGRRD